MRKVAGPAKEKADAGGQETRAEAAVEPGEEVGGDARYVLKTYAKGNHESDDKVSLQTESPEDAGFFLRHGKNAFGVFSNHSGKHHVEGDEYQNGQGDHPNQSPGSDNLKIVAHAGNGNLRPDGRPKEAVDCQKVYRLYLEHKLYPEDGCAANIYLIIKEFLVKIVKGEGNLSEWGWLSE